MKKHRIAFTVAAFAAAVLLFAAPVAQACCTPCTWCTDETDPNFVCCTGIPVPGDACGHTTCGKYLCNSKKCHWAEAEDALAMTPLAAPAQPAVDGCQEVQPPLLAPAQQPAAPAEPVAAE